MKLIFVIFRISVLTALMGFIKIENRRARLLIIFELFFLKK